MSSSILLMLVDIIRSEVLELSNGNILMFRHIVLQGWGNRAGKRWMRAEGKATMSAVISLGGCVCVVLPQSI